MARLRQPRKERLFDPRPGQQLLGDDWQDDGLARDLYRLSGGNFTRLLEILRDFLKRGVLKTGATGAVVYKPKPHELELELGKSLYMKYRGLGRMEQEVLERAAFLGHRFPFGLLLSFSKLEETALVFVTRTLVLSGFLVELNQDWYAFTNRALQSHLADHISATNRRQLHSQVCRLLRAQGLLQSTEGFQLGARHYSGCERYEEAVRCLLESAHRARSEYREALSRELYQEILRIYRHLYEDRQKRQEVVKVLRDWFRRDGNWISILSKLASRPLQAAVRITDFGISYRLEDQRRGYSVAKPPRMGTPRYLSPERARGEHGDTRSDIFALGVIAYEMIVGQPPFPDVDGRDVVRANRDLPIRYPAGCLEDYPPRDARASERDA